MKFISFLNSENLERAGLLVDDQIIDLEFAARELVFDFPPSMKRILKGLPGTFKVAQEIVKAFHQGRIKPLPNQKDIKLLAPIPVPTSCRDGYAFRQHVETARRNRGLEMIPEFDQFPVFYFTNHNAIIGPGVLEVETDHLDKLDFELEVAIAVGKQGRNIRADKADEYIFGLMIMNDFSARTLQMDEMKLNLGPAKGKDFATAIGPWLVTLDELAPFKISTPRGNKYDLEMKAFHNGKQVSQGNLKDMNWTFAEILERVSYGVDILPGDVIGSGTVGTGCYLELNGTAALKAKETGTKFDPVWLNDGDLIELEVTGLGKLAHKIVKRKDSYSLKK